MSYPKELSEIGCFIEAKDKAKKEEGASKKVLYSKIEVSEFTEQEIEKLAKMEHDFWVEEKIQNGWTVGDEYDSKRKVSNLLKPWDEMNDEGRQNAINPCRNIINLLQEAGFKVVRYVGLNEPAKEYHGFKTRKIPLILGVSGHIFLAENEIEFRKKEEIISKKVDELIDRLIYNHTVTVKKDARENICPGQNGPARGLGHLFRKGSIQADGMEECSNEHADNIILMTALAEGSDRIVARAALKRGVTVAPIIPMEGYETTFEGFGYGEKFDPASIQKSIEDYKSILAEENCLEPCYLNPFYVHKDEAYGDLSAYLISNCHIMISVWNGRSSEHRGSTYDSLRMAMTGVDNDLLVCTAPKSTFTASPRLFPTHHVNSVTDCLFYWIKVDRDRPNEDKQSKDCAPEVSEGESYFI